MGLKDLFKDKNHPVAHKTQKQPPLSPAPKPGPSSADSPPGNYGYTAKISGNEIDGFTYRILRNGRLQHIPAKPMYSGDRKKMENVERVAKQHLAELRKKEATKAEKEIS